MGPLTRAMRTTKTGHPPHRPLQTTEQEEEEEEVQSQTLSATFAWTLPRMQWSACVVIFSGKFAHCALSHLFTVACFYCPNSSWPCLHQWLETKPMRPTCPVCKSAVTREQVIPLYGRGSDKKDPREKKIPPRPQGQRTEQSEYNVSDDHFIR